MATAAQLIPGQQKDTASAIRKIATRFPDLSNADIARRVGCSRENVSKVLQVYLDRTSPEELADFQENKAEVYDAIQHKLLSSLSAEKIANSKVMEAVTAAAILEDKARLVRGQATGINVNILLDVVDAMRQNSKTV